MREEPDPQLVRNDEVTCAGPTAMPHLPRHLILPSDATVACPDCGKRFCRAPEWRHVTRANWPKVT